MTNRRPIKRYMGDFETTTEDSFKRDGMTRAWAVSVRDINTNEKIVLGNSMNDFFKFIETQDHDQLNKEVYFHNLKFDGSFIIDALFRRGYKVLRPDETPRRRTFDTIISNMGTWYSITIYHAVYGKPGHLVYVKTTIRDSYKKLPFGAKVLAEAFKLNVSKLEINYDTYRAYNHNLTEEEEEYVETDTSIVAQALKIQFDQGLTAMTIGGDALGYFKASIGKKYDYYFPILDQLTDDDIRRSYKGGYTYCHRPGEIIYNVRSFDKNSLYPFVMHSSSGCLLPYGVPKYFKGRYKKDKHFPLYVQRLQLNFRLKKDHIPMIQIKNNYKFVDTEYLTSSDGEMVELTLTNVDLALIESQYDILDIIYLDGYKFRGKLGIFDDYIDKWTEVKINNEGALRQLAKLMLNNLYGKFGTNPIRKNRIPRFNKITQEVEYSEIVESVGKPAYTPMASFITAYARDQTIREAQRQYKRFIYADTDSLHLEGVTTPIGLDVDPKRLGAWKDEGLAVRAYFIRAKTYIKEYLDDGIKVTCAGMPDAVKEQCTFDNFKAGAVFSGKLTAKKVRGGTILVERDFTIKL